MNGVLVVINCCKYCIQVHEGSGFWNHKGKDGTDLAFRITEQMYRKNFESFRCCALGNADCQRISRQIQDVAAFNMEVGIPVHVEWCADVIRMIFEDVVRIDCFTIAGREGHLVQRDAAADGSKRIPGKVQIRHRITDDRIVILYIIHQRIRGDVPDLIGIDPCNAGLDQIIRLLRQQIFGNCLSASF